MITIKKIPVLAIWAFCLTFLVGCDQEYIPDTSESEQEIVVEGYIEAGPGSNPTFVILTKSIPFLSTISSDKFTELFINGASVTVNDGDKTVALNEICLKDVPDELKKQVYELLGLNSDSAVLDICVYADLFSQIKKEPGRKYDLKVNVGDKQLSATTTIPEFVPLFGFRWDDPPGIPNDTFARLFVTINDPADKTNYYRYFTSEGKNALIAPFNSVVDDAIFGGKEFEFPLQKAERRGADFGSDSFGLFTRGDSVTIKWVTLDKAHYDFWRTRDFSANSGGPFSSYTRIATNIEGGLGIWGGYAVEQYKLFAPPK